MSTVFNEGTGANNAQNVVRAVKEFLQQATDRKDVPQDVRDRARELKAQLSQQAAGGTAMSL
ncbi:hypothetical protein GCM10022224_007870 [Nonomuraea antimicrobica]|uniref:Uncharacterized protein n=1 Tax=Nonomuraea antimicrobica TaxID=561173 RepID=A0ABP7B2S8_9ACTN